ncbi:hypothetical protein D043_2854A, partial [Vibrio parahaemolyticus EKP-021]|jgi:hypothetical protein
MNH